MSGSAQPPDDAGVPEPNDGGDPGPDHVSPEQGSGKPLPGWSAHQPPPFTASSGAASAGRRAAGGGWTPPPPAPKPGIIPLRPLQVGEVMTGAIDYVRWDPRTVIAISAIMGVVAAIGQIVILGMTASKVAELPMQPTPDLDPRVYLRAVLALLGIALATSVIAGLLQILGTGMLTHVLGRSVIGKHTSLGEAWDLVRPQFLRLLGVTVLVSLASILALLLPIAPGAALIWAGATAPGALLLLLGVFAGIALTVWVAFTLILATPALALEDCGVVMALKRSRRLVSGAFWRTLGMVLLGSIVAQAVGTVAAIPFSLAGGAGSDLSTFSVFALALAALVTVMVALPFVAGVTALVYLDRRIRTENLGTVLAAAAQQ